MTDLDLTGRLPPGTPLVTRFAPSPTGHLHLGHVVNAIYVWGIARALGARVLLRIEDHDRIRCRREYEASILADLDWLGFTADAGRFPLVRQSERDAVYQAALRTLAASHQVYTCRCSRREVGGERYAGSCRERGLTFRESAALRVRLEPGEEVVNDLFGGLHHQVPSDQCGDLLIRDRDGHWTYQFAVTVDDLEQEVTLIIRGLDLQSSTGRQQRLARMLGRTVLPIVAHHPLIVDEAGRKLSKSDGASGVGDLRRAGLSPARVIGQAAAMAGLVPPGVEVAATAVGRFWDRI